jgi:hypothetical protein
MGAPAGLVRADLTPKPVYKRLHRLIRERWWTEARGHTDRDGRLAFRGFCGDYFLEGAGEPLHFAIDCAAPDGLTIDLRRAR